MFWKKIHNQDGGGQNERDTKKTPVNGSQVSNGSRGKTYFMVLSPSFVRGLWLHVRLLQFWDPCYDRHFLPISINFGRKNGDFDQFWAKKWVVFLKTKAMKQLQPNSAVS
jgi:hypothetical protein